MLRSDEREGTARETMTENERFIRRAWIVAAVAVLVIVTLFVVWRAHRILLVLFAGGLLAVFLHSVSDWIHSRTPLSRRFAMFASLAGLLILIVLVGWLTAPSIVDQAAQLGPALMDAVDAIETRLDDLPFAGQIQEGAPGNLIDQIGSVGADLVGRVTDLFSTTVNLLVEFVVILFVGIYFAYQPQIYLNGVLTLVPQQHRTGTREALIEVYRSLRWWLVGRLAAMIILATMATIGLLLLGMPLALLLGALVGLLEFIPYIGPAISLVPALLIALGISPTQALYVLLLYLGLQVLESYILTPIIEQRVVSVAPVLLIGTQLTLGTLFGFWGLLLAPALIVVSRVFIKKFYVEDTLGDHSVSYISEDHEDEDG
ncbi:MAG: AI-2E family transporter [Chloroflexota bacterium]